jgi:hypothetical protein
MILVATRAVAVAVREDTAQTEPVMQAAVVPAQKQHLT